MEVANIIGQLLLFIAIIAWINTSFNHEDQAAKNRELLYSIFSQLNQINMNQEQLLTELNQLKDQVEKTRIEVAGKISNLEEAIINAGNVTPEVETALQQLKASVQLVDDIVPDAVELPPAPPAEETAATEE